MRELQRHHPCRFALLHWQRTSTTTGLLYDNQCKYTDYQCTSCNKGLFISDCSVRWKLQPNNNNSHCTILATQYTYMCACMEHVWMHNTVPHTCSTTKTEQRYATEIAYMLNTGRCALYICSTKATRIAALLVSYFRSSWRVVGGVGTSDQIFTFNEKTLVNALDVKDMLGTLESDQNTV